MAELQIYDYVFTAEDVGGQLTKTLQPSDRSTTFRISITDDDVNEREETLVVKPMVNVTNDIDRFVLSTTRPHATFEIQIDGNNPDSESMQLFDLCSSLYSLHHFS